MDLIEQKDKLDISNVDTQIIKKTSRHGPLLPDTIRAIIVGPSGSDADKVIKPNLTKKNSVIIFDDVLCGPQSIIREYFGMCRHSGASSVFYLAQTYSKIPKQLIWISQNFGKFLISAGIIVITDLWLLIKHVK
ncbi:uncharacterized protein LOC126554387 isoform X2 [Aphis gossypii]|uniref:uncharacterized protein LOC126554164 n=1 Tax=Aphis gossypii TaxID=80765 RepID=UPI002159A590|nr:uncharacterized protein LOC126549356 isoform X2 [Aphis gossypii]XP_050056859.1 uncharacterized protein LOC126550065 isoform X2 [Aphis gossypii]XP_050058398.1 uncharacterized protein LOC126550610 isoform X2 [Aphis gossypii]XP_050061460.1 uncharacterized protein LOC126551608 isoform X2 [Aphis gossypii]XP_050063979.1 uncharacterized protein LOC126552900 isoform X2 [Aphis gossypii]XP_050065129.1 uncharacterized protein LOC126554057 isoform X2 [Aphis gossypii]XP_050065219.1 uncharacterized prot